MVNRKKIRTRRKLQLSRYFQKFQEGEAVAVVNEPAVQFSFPKRLKGRTGKIEGKKGRVYLVKIQEKKFLIAPIHLKKIKQIKNNTK